MIGAGVYRPLNADIKMLKNCYKRFLYKKKHNWQNNWSLGNNSFNYDNIESVKSFLNPIFQSGLLSLMQR